MEIEAKFSLPTVEVLQSLQAADHLAGFTLADGTTKQVCDTYLDTNDRLILAAGYACRRRQEDDQLVITLKGLRKAEGAIHRREELEITLPQYLPPFEWPDSPVRDLVLGIIGNSPLKPLFDLHQTRNVRPLQKGDRLVADMSLDDVHLAAGGRKEAFFELEVELKGSGTEDELGTIATCLRNEWGLVPESRSKFERALIFLGEIPPPGEVLTAEERAVCVQLARRNDLHGRRALALLALDEGTSQAIAGQQSNMSERRVRHWLAEFRKTRLDVFPARILATIDSQAVSSVSSIPLEVERQLQASQTPQPWPLELLFDRYEVDRSHARSVARFALVLFDQLQPIHNLAPERRHVLKIAAMLHDIGVKADAAHHETVGRDILLLHPPAGLNESERQIVEITTLLHRQSVAAGNAAYLVEKFATSLSESERLEALALAAIVRMADGLDYSQGNSELGRIEQQAGQVTFEVLGSFSSVDAKRAQKKSDLWSLLYDIQVRFSPVPSPNGEAPPEEPVVSVVEVHETEIETPAEPELPSSPGLQADDTMAEGARKTFLFHFLRMKQHEAGTRLGEDIEELHDMRVATRRMRAAVPVFGDFLDLDKMKPFIKGMRRTGRALGSVRDLDVFQEKTEKYLKKLPKDRKDDLEPLYQVWGSQREIARERMLSYLDSAVFERFKQDFGEFLKKPGAGALPAGWQTDGPKPHRLRQVVPVALFQRFAEVRAYDEWMTGPNVPLERYHQLRIASKGLRYTLEYFSEILGPETKSVINDVKALQDNLGDLNDAVVACNLLRDFLTWGTWGHADQPMSPPTNLIVAPGVTAYLAARQIELQQLIKEFPEAWARVNSPDFAARVAAAVSIL